MKRAVVVGLAAAVIIGLGFWLWTILFPTPEKVIRSRLNAFAKTISFEAGSGMISKTYSAQKAAGFFTTNVDVELNLAGYETVTLHGRDEVLQIAMASRSRLTALKVEFPDMNITLAPDGQTAKVNLTAKATMPEERDISAQEFDFKLKKVNGVWLIDHVETVKTLSCMPQNLNRSRSLWMVAQTSRLRVPAASRRQDPREQNQFWEISSRPGAATLRCRS
ncbi:MAG TPA: hypothetical protein VN873_04290 [Candidatus Angelobacter sp.]|nr:hypothetical protein [Candidatus Angelobacter sp.]